MDATSGANALIVNESLFRRGEVIITPYKKQQPLHEGLLFYHHNLYVKLNVLKTDISIHIIIVKPKICFVKLS